MCTGYNKQLMIGGPGQVVGEAAMSGVLGVYNYFFGGSSSTKVTVANDYNEDVYAKVDREKCYITEGEISGGNGAGKGKVRGKFEWYKVIPGFTLIKKNNRVVFELAVAEGTQVFISIRTKSGEWLADNLPKIGPCGVIVNKDGQVVDEKKENTGILTVRDMVRIGF